MNGIAVGDVGGGEARVQVRHLEVHCPFAKEVAAFFVPGYKEKSGSGKKFTTPIQAVMGSTWVYRV